MKKLSLALALVLALGACCKAQDQPRTPEAVQAPEAKPEPEPPPKPMPPQKALIGHWVFAGIHDGGRTKQGEPKGDGPHEMEFDATHMHFDTPKGIISVLYEIKKPQKTTVQVWADGMGFVLGFTTDDLMMVIGGYKKGKYTKAKTIHVYTRSRSPMDRPIVPAAWLMDRTRSEAEAVVGDEGECAPEANLVVCDYGRVMAADQLRLIYVKGKVKGLTAELSRGPKFDDAALEDFGLEVAKPTTETHMVKRWKERIGGWGEVALFSMDQERVSRLRIQDWSYE